MEPPRPYGLAHLPTPLEEAPALSRLLGVRLLIKRDDCTGLATGGNKVRKLDWILAGAGAAGADTLVTFGGVQSNHARTTAAAAARAGMGCLLLLGGREPARPEGNLLLDRLFGAGIRYLGLTPSTLTGDVVRQAFRQESERLREAGRRPLVIPAGGSQGTGVAACTLAWLELEDQLDGAGRQGRTVVVCFGTGGTFAGLALGNIMTGRRSRLVGISAAPPGMPEAVGVEPLEALVREGAGALESMSPAHGGEAARALGELGEEDLRVDHRFAGRAYGAVTPGCLEAIHLAARKEGILLDPVYTAKAMDGLISMCRSGEIAPGSDVIFWHTGGIPGIFPFAGSLAGGP